MSDAESLDYLQTGFDPSSLTVPRLRSILVSHNVQYPSSAKKQRLIELFIQNVLPNARKLISQRAKAKRSSYGITDADSQDSTVADEELMPPPPTPRPKSGRKTSSRIKSEERESESDLPVTRSPTKRTPRASSRHTKASDTETGTGSNPDAAIQKPTRRSRKSEAPTPRPKPKSEEDHLPVPRKRREDLGDSRREIFFTSDNPFQQGSSSPPSDSRASSGERKRKSLGASVSKDLPRKISSTTRRRTESSKPEATSTKYQIPVDELNALKDYDENGVEASEEFTPEEQLELTRERAAKGVNALGPTRPKKQDAGMSKVGPIWVVLLTLLSGYLVWYRQEKVAVGYCGVGRDTRQIIRAGVQLPDWMTTLAEPPCEPCPQHAYCSDRLSTQCEKDFVLKHHPLSLGGIIPIPPTCEPDGEKQRRVKTVADRAVEELRERRAKWECGDLVDEQGIPEPAVEIDEENLKSEVSSKRRKGLGAAEFDDLWKTAIPEIKARDEVVSVENGPHHLITSTSLSRLPLSCSLRRTLRLHLARHRLFLGILALFAFTTLYIRSHLRSLATTNAAIPHLVSLTLDRLATQASLHTSDPDAFPEAWISIGQLRDDMLRDEHSVKKREKTWGRVRKVVEMNANVRASQREGRNGEVSRVWEWIGAVRDLDDEAEGKREKRKSGSRVSWGVYDDRSSPVSGMDEGPEGVRSKWQEGTRSIF